MAIHFSPEYFLVSIRDNKYAWERENPAPRHATQKVREAYWAKQKAAWAASREKCAADKAKLKAVGLPTERRFQREDAAKKYAATLKRDYGIEADVCKAMDMGF